MTITMPMTPKVANVGVLSSSAPGAMAYRSSPVGSNPSCSEMVPPTAWRSPMVPTAMMTGSTEVNSCAARVIARSASSMSTIPLMIRATVRPAEVRFSQPLAVCFRTSSASLARLTESFEDFTVVKSTRPSSRTPHPG
ncbi:hypothetical protein BTZ20_5490 [Rhodococcus sp. MTM3W5.2]|uniref:hypothetical protein n=1 Tax=Rhodococcus sp. MTM3W5.2 TaxID=1805827 RepID=UPI0009791828|nr:hypothetical protein [Rhodococcus sp. MTM3W5.2]AQA20698.1 hypothetical protein BTZ20_5490 [Rhodococcus sp. MTM3W5.2]